MTENKSAIIVEAAKIAANVASEAAVVAREVASRASETATKVADLALKTQESVLILGNDVNYIKGTIAEIKTLLDSKYVTKEEFNSHKKDDV